MPLNRRSDPESLRMKYISLDVEVDGPCQPIFSMVCFGAVLIDKHLETTFYGKTRPISDLYIPENLAISGFTREQHLGFPDPAEVLPKFVEWIKEVAGTKVCLISDVLTGDWACMNYYFHKYCGFNPFGYGHGRRLSDIIGGMENDLYFKWKHMKSKENIHDPVFDALENAKIFRGLKHKGLHI